MKKNYFLPHFCSRIGWGFVLSGAIFFALSFAEVIPEIMTPVFSIIPLHNFVPDFSEGCFWDIDSINDELGTIAIMVGLVLVAFSSETDDDEFTDALRLRSWFLACITYGVIYILIDLLVYGFPYLVYMCFVQGGLLMFIYIVIFKSKLYIARHSKDEQ